MNSQKCNLDIFVVNSWTVTVKLYEWEKSSENGREFTCENTHRFSHLSMYKDQVSLIRFSYEKKKEKETNSAKYIGK